jgi:hypothetical protein
MGTIREWQLVIMGFLWAFLLFVLFPPMIKDIIDTFKELFILLLARIIIFFKRIRKFWAIWRKTKEIPADGTAEIQKKKHSKYIITNSCTDFHRQNLERWR